MISLNNFYMILKKLYKLCRSWYQSTKTSPIVYPGKKMDAFEKENLPSDWYSDTKI